MRGLKQITEELAQVSKANAPLAARFIESGLEGDDLTQFRANTQKLETLYGEKADAERTEADHQRDRDAAQRSIEIDKHFNQPNGQRVSGRQPVGEQRKREAEAEWSRSIGERFATSEQLKEFRRRIGEGRGSQPFAVGSFYDGHADEVERRFGPGPDEQRALITSTTLTTVIQPQRLPGIFTPDLRELRVRDVLASGRTGSNLVEFVREASRTNNAAEVAEATSLVDGAKPESGFTLEEANAPVRTIATLMYITRAALDDADQMQSYIEQLLRRFIEEREDRQILIGDGIAPNLRGLINQSGIQNLNGAYFTTTMPNKLDRLRRAKTRIRLGGRGRATAMILHPENVEEFELMKTNSTAGNNEYAALGGGPFGAAAGGRIWGLPYVENEDLTVNKAVVLDGTAAMVMDRMDAQIFVTDSNRDLFERNIITILCESRLALPVFFPGKIAYVDLAATA